MSELSAPEKPISFDLLSLDDFEDKQKLGDKAKDKIYNTKQIIFVENARKILNEYNMRNSFKLEIAQYKMPESTTIIDIIDYTYLISSDLKAYRVCFYEKCGALGVLPFYHYYNSPYLSDVDIVKCADNVLYCEGCNNVIEWEEKNPSP